MTLSAKLPDFWHRFQGELFPALAEEVGPLLGTPNGTAAKRSPSNAPKTPPRQRQVPLLTEIRSSAAVCLPVDKHVPEMA